MLKESENIDPPDEMMDGKDGKTFVGVLRSQVGRTTKEQIEKAIDEAIISLKSIEREIRDLQVVLKILEALEKYGDEKFESALKMISKIHFEDLRAVLAKLRGKENWTISKVIENLKVTIELLQDTLKT